MQTLEPASQTATLDLLNTGKVKIHSHADDPRWQLAWRIASSGSLGRSRLLARFLLFIVDRHIRDRADEITEQQIGILVFDRAEGYDSNEDNIVRSYARNLRRRIENYYANEGKGEPMHLEIPRGGYAPFFSPRDFAEEKSTLSSARTDAAVVNGTLTSHDGEPATSTARLCTSFSAGGEAFAARPFLRRYGMLLALCIGVLTGLLITVMQPLRFLKRSGEASPEVVYDFWRQMFNVDQDTFVVPSDDGLVIMQRLTERPVPLASYISGSYRNENSQGGSGDAEILKLGARRYTSVVDLDFAVHLTQINAVDSSRLIVRYARDLRMDDLRTGNTVLIGSVESNPWIQLFAPQMNFRQCIHADPRIPSGLLNTHPRPGERNLYGTPGQDHTYGLIAFLPNLTSTGHVLIVGGLNTAGTQAATTFLLTPSLMEPILQRARASHGQFRSFELLVGAANFSSNASAPQMIVERINTH
jgi:hypothetical protein